MQTVIKYILMFFFILGLGISYAQVVEYKKASGLELNEITGVFQNAEGDIFFGGINTITKQNGTSYTLYSFPADVAPQMSTVKQFIWVNSSLFYVLTTEGRLLKLNASGVLVSLDGFTNISITAIAKDDSGVVWAVGNRFLYQLNSTAEQNVFLPFTKEVTQMSFEGDVLWLAITDEGLVRYDGSKWDLHRINLGDKQYGENSFAIDSKGNKWVFNKSVGVGKFDGTNWVRYLVGDIPLLQFMQSIFIDGNDEVWLMSQTKGICHLEGAYWKSVNYHSGLMSNRISALASDPNGKLYLSSQRGYTCYQNDTISNYILESSLPGDVFINSYFDSKNRKWLSTQLGTLVIDSLEVLTDEINSKVKLISFLSIAEEVDGIIWGTTSDGVWRFEQENSWKHYTTNSGLINNFVSKVAIDGNNRKWFATRGGISVFVDGKWLSYNVSDGLPFTNANGIAIDRKGRVWVSSMEIGTLAYFDGNYWYSSQFGGEGAQSLLIDYDENIWVSTYDEGLFKFDGAVWKQFTDQGFLSSNLVLNLALNSQNALLYSASGSAEKYDGKTWYKLINNDVDYYMMSFDKQGYLWLLNEQAITRTSQASPFLEVSHRYVKIDEENTPFPEILIQSNSVQWTLKPLDDWLQVDVLSGSGNEKIHIYTEYNFTGQDREGRILVSANGVYNRVIYVYQGPTYLTGELARVKEGVDPNVKVFQQDGNLFVEGDEIKSLELFSVNGSKLSYSTKSCLSVSEFQAGVYVLRIELSNGSIQMKKVLVN